MKVAMPRLALVPTIDIFLLSLQSAKRQRLARVPLERNSDDKIGGIGWWGKQIVAETRLPQSREI